VVSLAGRRQPHAEAEGVRSVCRTSDRLVEMAGDDCEAAARRPRGCSVATATSNCSSTELNSLGCASDGHAVDVPPLRRALDDATLFTRRVDPRCCTVRSLGRARCHPRAGLLVCVLPAAHGDVGDSACRAAAPARGPQVGVAGRNPGRPTWLPTPERWIAAQAACRLHLGIRTLTSAGWSGPRPRGYTANRPGPRHPHGHPSSAPSLLN
jgi:hypothetical protein